jgi:predicted molibdopterin-dependent oxidoreductase YjgC
MPIRGHSGVQGGAEMGCYSTVFPGGRKISPETAEEMASLWGFPVPSEPGFIASEMIEAASKEELEVLISVGGNFLEVLPDPEFVEAALLTIPLRVHYDIVCTPQMLLEPQETVILLPATTRYEIAGGVTETTTERRVVFSPEIQTGRIGEARSEWEVFLDIARRVRPEIADRLTYQNTGELRQEIARVVPQYAGIQHLREKGDQFQYGGAHLAFGWKFDTPDGKASFSILSSEKPAIAEGYFLVSSRRGKQFNSMVQEKRDQITGAMREAILMNPIDAQKLGLREGDRVRLKNSFGEYEGNIYTAPVKPSNLQVHWPESNRLLDKSKRSIEGVPDYNALVSVERV